MAITAISKITVSNYVPLCDRDSDESDQTSFKLSPLNGVQYMEVIAELSTNSQGDTMLSGQGLKLAIKYGLVGWDNFRDEDGNELKFNKLNVAKVPPTILTELASEIIERSDASGEERKN